MLFGYARVSTLDQNLDLQIDALTKYGCEKIYEEKMSGSRTDRPQLQEMIKFLRTGDSVGVYKLDRISRSTKHLIELSEMFETIGVNFISLQDKIDTSTAMGRFFFRTMASISELEKDIIRERTRAGLEAARARGRKGGRPRTDEKKVEMAIRMHGSKQYSLNEISEATGISKSTLYRYLHTKKSV